MVETLQSSAFQGTRIENYSPSETPGTQILRRVILPKTSPHTRPPTLTHRVNYKAMLSHQKIVILNKA